MLFDQATAAQMQAVRIFAGATMAAFLAAGIFRGQAHRVRIMVAAVYIAGVLGFVLYVLI